MTMEAPDLKGSGAAQTLKHLQEKNKASKNCQRKQPDLLERNRVLKKDLVSESIIVKGRIIVSKRKYVLASVYLYMSFNKSMNQRLNIFFFLMILKMLGKRGCASCIYNQ